MISDEALKKQQEREAFERERERKRLEAKQKASEAASQKSTGTNEQHQLLQKQLERERLEAERQRQRQAAKNSAANAAKPTVSEDEALKLLQKQLERERLEAEKERKRIEAKQEAQRQAQLSQEQERIAKRNAIEQLYRSNPAHTTTATSSSTVSASSTSSAEKIEKSSHSLPSPTLVSSAPTMQAHRGPATPTAKTDKQVTSSPISISSPAKSPLVHVVSRLVEGSPIPSDQFGSPSSDSRVRPGSPMPNFGSSNKDDSILSSSPGNSMVCSVCDKPITGKYLENSEGKRIHSECMKSKKKVCNKCGQAITGSKVAANNLYWHPKCFTCTFCQKELETTFVLKKQKAYCNSDCYANHRKSGSHE